MKKVMLVFGTRPEAIKMCPLVNELKTRDNIETIVCVSGQHRQMLDQVLNAFGVVPDYDLSIMQDKQTLFDITTNILNRIKAVLDEVKPDVVLVHGDTSTTFVTALACYYCQIPIGHVEAGLRTYNIFSPYPEEFNRQAVSIIATYNFAPTELSKNNLIGEGKHPSTIYVTGNTAIDALKTTVRDNYSHEQLVWAADSRLIMLTAHRRENLGEPLRHMFRAIKRIVDETPDIKVIYPIHFNPVVREAAQEIFGNCERVRIIEPLDVLDFHNFLARSYLILTDSGGIQEEAPSLRCKPVLVMRDTTERPEGIAAGTLRLVGTDEKVIYDAFKQFLLLTNSAEYDKMSHASNPYGDGFACKRIQCGHLSTAQVVYQNGEKDYKSGLSQAHKTLFFSGNMMRPSCYNCKYTNFYRPSDITIADFWGIEKHMPEFFDDKGVSLVMVNSQKGKDAFDSIIGSIEYRESNTDVCKHSPLHRQTKPSPRRNAFWRDYKKNGYGFVINKYGGYGLKNEIKRMIGKILRKTGLLNLVKNMLGRK
jgi:UDP-N-acetylglucosamine 2-epimerase (non-hydrolysing)